MCVGHYGHHQGKIYTETFSHIFCDSVHISWTTTIREWPLLRLLFTFLFFFFFLIYLADHASQYIYLSLLGSLASLRTEAHGG